MIEHDDEYFDEQFMYGHREVLMHDSLKQRYMKSGDYILAAGLQHGWLPEEGIWRLRKKNLQRAPRYVWNSRWENLLPTSTKNKAIGAPWLYLLRSLGLNQDIVKVKRFAEKKYLIFPGHSGLSFSKNFVEQAKYFGSICDPSSSTVCLFWLDYCNSTYRRAFENEGFVVECVGFGSARKSDAKYNDSDRVVYLLNLFEMMIKHEILVTDEFSSGALYALSLGLKIKYAPNYISRNFTSKVIKNIRSDTDGFYKTDSDWVLNFAPEILGTNLKPSVFIELAWTELGFDSMLTSKQIASLDWIPYKGVANYNESYSEGLLRVKNKNFFEINK